jgi:hypothetical protein
MMGRKIETGRFFSNLQSFSSIPHHHSLQNSSSNHPTTSHPLLKIAYIEYRYNFDKRNLLLSKNQPPNPLPLLNMAKISHSSQKLNKKS